MINPVSINSALVNNSQVSSQDETIQEQLMDLITAYRAHMEDKNPAQELAILAKLESFLSNPKNQSLMQEQCYMSHSRCNGNENCS